MKTVCVSGGFDPIHVGHLELLKRAREHGDELVVILNNDNWLKKKKGYAFMSESERKTILEEFSCVDRVILTSHEPNSEDTSVCNELRTLKPTIFANGGDRKEGNIPEYTLCDDLGIEMVFNLGAKVQSSSDLVKNAMSALKD